MRPLRGPADAVIRRTADEAGPAHTACDGPVRTGRHKTGGAAPLCAVTVLPNMSSG